MGKQSGFLRRQKEDSNALMHSTEVLVKQYMVDTLLITMNKKKFGWGFDRLMRLLDEWEETREEYRAALNPLKDNEADVAQAHMDQAISTIINGRMPLIPFEERYADLKPVTYDKRSKNK